MEWQDTKNGAAKWDAQGYETGVYRKGDKCYKNESR